MLFMFSSVSSSGEVHTNTTNDKIKFYINFIMWPFLGDYFN